jgi:P-type Ca2+ transporter type 2C
MKKWYGKTITRVVRILDSDINLGLNDKKIAQMRENYGDNLILKPKIESLLSLIIKEIRQLWVIESLFFITMLFYNKLPIIGVILTSILIISFEFIIHGDYKEEKSLMVIDNLNTSFCFVVRNGKSCKISCEELVVGDVVYLEKGGHVPADIRIIESKNLLVMEVTVTGENYEVEKYSMKMEGEVINLSQIKNMVFKSSIVTKGSGKGIVIATGMNTQIGKIASALLEYKNDNRVFTKNLAKIANKAALTTIIVGLLTLLFTLYENYGIHGSINVVIYIFMTFNSPIFIIMLFLFFKFTFYKLKKKNIYIKNISTIYFLSKITTIFTKKIGGISESKLVFREVYCDNIIIDVQGQSLSIEDSVERIISIALLCNEGSRKRNYDNSIENLAEKSIFQYCNEKFAEKVELEIKQRRILKIPYDSDRRIKTVVNKIDNRYRANVTGTLDGLLNRCTHILINGVEKEIKDFDMETIINVHIEMSNKDYNVVGFAYRNFNYEPSINENIESNLVFVGLIGFENPIKSSSYAAVKSCKDNNIGLIIDEEDNKLAALAFGRLMGIASNKEEILSGIEIDYMSKEEFEKNIEEARIFSKISPKHKSEIINSLNEKGHFIASTGDSLTDLEYLYNSHISISTGNECSIVIRKLSSLFLQENDLSEIINLVHHSKMIINYLSELALFLIVTGLSQILIILLCLITSGKMPFTIVEILYLNTIIVPCSGLSILLQNTNNMKEIKKINYKNIKKVSVLNLLIISGVYLFTFLLIDKFSIINIGHTAFIIFTLYQNLFLLMILSIKRFSKNKISYTVFLLNLVLQGVFIFICLIIGLG